VEQRWDKIGKKITLPPGTSPADIVAYIFGSDLIRLEGPYNGNRQRRADLYSMGSKLIAKFVKETKLVAYATGVTDGLEVPAQTRAIVAVLKELIWAYVIQSPALAAQQHGQREAIRSIFLTLFRALGDGKHYLFPAAFQDQARELHDNATPVQRARVTADAVASLTDQQALRLFQRLTASSQGSVLDPIVR
jgi:dGTPase